jgi:hypothetical protein
MSLELEERQRTVLVDEENLYLVAAIGGHSLQVLSHEVWANTVYSEFSSSEGWNPVGVEPARTAGIQRAEAARVKVVGTRSTVVGARVAALSAAVPRTRGDVAGRGHEPSEARRGRHERHDSWGGRA